MQDQYKQVITAGNYNVYISPGLVDVNVWFANNAQHFSNVFVLVDENTRKHCLPLVLETVKSLAEAVIIEIRSGEDQKNIQTCCRVWETLSRHGDRKSLLVNLGGGVITDMGGYAAGCFKRGIRFVNIPTTLLSQVDASVGAKTGIDFGGLKNEIGLFNNPEAVLVSTQFLGTLPERQVLSGYAEMLKHGLIADKNYWETLSSINPHTVPDWTEYIARSVSIKNKIVLQDPTEKGLRKVLNFGHTIGHAIESYSLQTDGDKALLHGEAIAAGMLMEAWLSVKVCGLSVNTLNSICNYVLKYYPTALFKEQEVLALLKFDKKNEGGKVLFSLIAGEGNAVINKECPLEWINEAFRYYKQATIV